MKKKKILIIVISVIVVITVLFLFYNNYMSTYLFNADGSRINGEDERQKVINAIQNI